MNIVSQEKQIKVYESWLRTLARYAAAAETEQGSRKEVAISALIGYASSAQILLDSQSETP